MLGSVPRIVLASMLAYLASQHHDVFAFNYLRKLTKGKALWLRNNVSTMVSQGMDTVIFTSIAFVGTIPLNVLLNMILGQYIVSFNFWATASQDDLSNYQCNVCSWYNTSAGVVEHGSKYQIRG